jgi:3-oxoacyl-[acyl-carrier protein] reductase
MGMNLGIGSQNLIVTGASSGLGKAVAERLAEEGASLLIIARRKELLIDLSDQYPGKITVITGDVREGSVQDAILEHCGRSGLDGIFVNAGGPPARKISETTGADWDEAYQLLIRWKVNLVTRLLPIMVSQGYGRILFSESASVKQPVDNLVLSNSLRLAIAGFSKTLSQEYAGFGITSNLIAPGYHDTEAVKRLFVKKSEQENISIDEAEKRSINTIPARKMGDPADFASLAAWLLSPLSGFMTGQVLSLDGGNVKSTL